MTLQVSINPTYLTVNFTQQPLIVTLSPIGQPGPAGVGVPAGGTTGQALTKIDDTDYNTQWTTVGGSGGIAWNEVTVTTVSMAVNNGYLMNNASRVIGTLPATAAQFSIIRVAGKGAGGWKIAQNAGQTIHFDGNSTTTGTAGYLASQSTFDCVDLLCITANTDFLVTSSIGNITGA